MYNLTCDVIFMTTKSHQRDIGVKVVPHKHRVVKDLKATAAEEQQLVASELMNTQHCLKR